MNERDTFKKLIISYCEWLGLSPSLILQGSPLIIEQVYFSVLYDEETAPSHFSVYCDFGEIPRYQAITYQEDMLETNLKWYMYYGICFTISPSNGHAVCALNLPVLETNKDKLQQTLHFMLGLCQSWKTTHSIR